MTKGELAIIIAVFAVATFTALHLRKQCETVWQRNDALRIILTR